MTHPSRTLIPLPASLPLGRRLYPDGPVTVAFANEGGGTRKTTGLVNTAVGLARRGFKVGIACLDQTMAASTYVGHGVTNRKYFPQRTERVYAKLAQMPNIYDVVGGRCGLKDVMVPARTRIVPVQLEDQGEWLDDERWDTDDCFQEIPNLSLILGSRDMAVASEDIRNGGRPGSRSKASLHWLRKAVEGLPPGTLDILLYDTRGTFDTLELSVLGASDYVVGCVKPDTKDDDTLHGLKALIRTAQEQFEFSGGAADLRFILFNGYVKNRGRFYLEIYEEFRAFYGDMLLPYVSENVQVAESVKAQEPVHYWMQADEPGELVEHDPETQEPGQYWRQGLQESLITAQFDAIGAVIARDLDQT